MISIPCINIATIFDMHKQYAIGKSRFTFFSANISLLSIFVFLFLIAIPVNKDIIVKIAVIRNTSEITNIFIYIHIINISRRYVYLKYLCFDVINDNAHTMIKYMTYLYILIIVAFFIIYKYMIWTKPTIQPKNMIDLLIFLLFLSIPAISTNVVTNIIKYKYSTNVNIDIVSQVACNYRYIPTDVNPIKNSIMK